MLYVEDVLLTTPSLEIVTTLIWGRTLRPGRMVTLRHTTGQKRVLERTVQAFWVDGKINTRETVEVHFVAGRRHPA